MAVSAKMPLDRDDDDQSPKSDGNHTEGIDLIGGVEVLVFKGLAKRVQRRCSDVPVNNAKSTEG
jgi:hypothetical protein